MNKGNGVRKILINVLLILCVIAVTEVVKSMIILDAKNLMIPYELDVSEITKEASNDKKKLTKEAENITTIASKEISQLFYDELNRNTLRDRGWFFKNLYYPTYTITPESKTNNFTWIRLDKYGNIEILVNNTIYKGEISKQVVDKFIREYSRNKK
ncbi:hypothetical protein [Clostridium sp. ZS2-4]|uniref:hypothetical protein n=1 Tax=Clostridium sp. ZS2-4 TaxID=2987703 RepID=UPI00227A1282|nr:hypothetical protein [Clostridium sp. ZS2-4]MCY6354942.1 hypothetical protein [Clostridium sp. ZS2-4]